MLFVDEKSDFQGGGVLELASGGVSGRSSGIAAAMALTTCSEMGAIGPMVLAAQFGSKNECSDSSMDSAPNDITLDLAASPPAATEAGGLGCFFSPKAGSIVSSMIACATSRFIATDSFWDEFEWQPHHETADPDRALNGRPERALKGRGKVLPRRSVFPLFGLSP